MSFSRLEWDSSFFGKEVGKIEHLDSKFSLIKELQIAKQKNADLVYYFNNQETAIVAPSILATYSGKKVDTKVVYRWLVPSEKINFDTSSDEIESYDQIIVREDLLELAYRSGIYSRFKLDKRFEEDHFKQLYYLWLKNSIEKKNADFVFVKKEGKEIIGFVTFKKRTDNFGEIGLIAVHENHSKKGIGRQLINKIKEVTIALNLSGFKVATQQENLGACNFYEKNNCQIITSTQIYHFWLNQ